MLKVALTPSGSDLALEVTGGDAAVWLNTLSGSTWRGWTALGGATPSAPSVSNIP
jgi:hypothetical protein